MDAKPAVRKTRGSPTRSPRHATPPPSTNSAKPSTTPTPSTPAPTSRCATASNPTDDRTPITELCQESCSHRCQNALSFKPSQLVDDTLCHVLQGPGEQQRCCNIDELSVHELVVCTSTYLLDCDRRRRGCPRCPWPVTLPRCRSPAIPGLRTV